MSSGLSTTTLPSQAENIREPSKSDDSFFNAWLTSPSQQQEARRSPSASNSSSASRHRSSKHISSAGLKESQSLSTTVGSGTTFHGVNASSESKLHRVSSSEQSANEIKSSQTSATHSQLQPISVCISGDREAKPENADVKGLLISTRSTDVVERSSSEQSERNFGESVPVNKDIGKNDEPETTVALLVSEAGTDDDRGVVLSAEPTLDTSASLGHFNSQMSSSILSPEPDDLLGTDGDVQLESGWNDASVSDMWLSSTVDLPETDDGDISLRGVRAQLDDQLDNTDVNFQCDEPADVVDNVDKSGQGSHERDEVSSDIAQDISNVLSVEVDVKAVKEISLPQVGMKEISSLEGSLETSADELSESNKTVVAEDSDVYCDDTDVDEMQLSGSTRSGNEQDHSVHVLSSELCHPSADISANADIEHDVSSGTNVAGQLTPVSAVHLDEDSEVCGTSPPSSCCVKNLLEEAMADSSIRDGTASAEPARIESGGNSGHTSADEIDTTTSSDIEIISHTSSVNGRPAGAHGSRPVDISPSRNSRLLSGQQHRRSDSGSSAQSLQSRTDDEFASPDADHSREYLTRPSRRHVAKSDPG